jgi:2'-5' RNA ligase
MPRGPSSESKIVRARRLKLKGLNKRKEALLMLDDFTTNVDFQGICIDELLAQEVNLPGTDQRYGVNLIAYPPDQVAEYIASIQDYLRAKEPNQYYYPPEEFHFTFLVICSRRTSNEANSIGARVRSHVASIMSNIVGPEVYCSGIFCNKTACILNLNSTNNQLERSRELVTEHLRKLDIEIVPRYSPESGHITFMRYLSPPITHLSEWRATLLRIPAPVGELSWKLGSLWLTHGATWYAMRGRISETGPYATQ